MLLKQRNRDSFTILHLKAKFHGTASASHKHKAISLSVTHYLVSVDQLLVSVKLK